MDGEGGRIEASGCGYDGLDLGWCMRGCIRVDVNLQRHYGAQACKIIPKDYRIEYTNLERSRTKISQMIQSVHGKGTVSTYRLGDI